MFFGNSVEETLGFLDLFRMRLESLSTFDEKGFARFFSGVLTFCCNFER